MPRLKPTATAPRWVALLIALLVVALTLLGWLGYQAWHTAHVVEIACAWGQLAPLPDSACEIEVEEEGGMFTRAFRVSFTAPAADVEAWLSRSLGAAEALRADPSAAHFSLTTSGGAQHAVLWRDPLCSGWVRVRIYTYWS